MPAADDIPAVAAVERGTGNVLGAVRHRAAADAEDEIDFPPFCEVDRNGQGFQRRVGFDAGEFDHRAPGQRGRHLVVNAIALDRAAAVEQQHPGVGRNQAVQLGEDVGAENDLGRIVIAEFEQVGHGRVLGRQQGRRGKDTPGGWRFTDPLFWAA